ncbi:OTU-like cysteine protease family protein, partial [Prunus dulcis]
MEGIVVRRAIPSDNSCLFNEVGYAMDHDKKKAPELRQVIAATVASDPTKYSEAFLGKSNEEYCSWILDSEKWEEAVEHARAQGISFTDWTKGLRRTKCLRVGADSGKITKAV